MNKQVEVSPTLKHWGHTHKLRKTFPMLDKFRAERFKKQYRREIFDLLSLFKNHPEVGNDLILVYVIMEKENNWEYGKTHRILDVCWFCGFIGKCKQPSKLN
jgi:hypothetical protein